MRCPGWGYCMSNREQTTCVSSVSCTFKQIYVIGTLLHLDWILMDHKIRAHTETHTAAHKHFALLRKLDCLVKIKMQRMCPISSFNTYAINFCSPLNVWKVWVCVCVYEFRGLSALWLAYSGQWMHSVSHSHSKSALDAGTIISRILLLCCRWHSFGNMWWSEMMIVFRRLTTPPDLRNMSYLNLLEHSFGRRHAD